MSIGMNINSLIESFLIKQTSSALKDTYTLLEHLQEIDGSNKPTDIASVEYYLNKIKEDTHVGKYCWPYQHSPYFTIEESKSFRDYYSKSNGTTLETYCMEWTQGYGSRTITDRIYDLEDDLRNTNDPEEIHRIKQDLANLGYIFDDNDDVNLIENASTIMNARYNHFDSNSWHKTIIDIENKLNSSINPDDIDFYKQRLLDLGWNPEIPYNESNQSKAKERIESIISESISDYNIIDIRPLIEKFNENEAISEANTGRKSKKLHPISIVLVRGNAAISKVITKVTNSEFSHAALCIDDDFERLYSFNFDNKINPLGGFSLESIKKYPQDNRLSVFTFFVNDEDYKKIEQRCQDLLENIKKTNYNIINLITFPFRMIDFSSSDNMICSQFVDNVLKLVNLDVTNKKSAKVAPNDLYKTASKSGKIYKVFDGITKDFNFKKVSSYVKKLGRSVKSINECKSLIEYYINPVVIEAMAPIEFRDDDILLRNNIFIDYDAEWSQSHRALRQYEQHNNIEGIKYELARLYYMNYILEKGLYHNKNLPNKTKNIKTRARILNDYNKYMNIVLSKDKSFNFSDYYMNSPYAPHTVQVKKSSLANAIKTTKDIMNYIL